MSDYERQCRWLLRAFPPDFRIERGEDLITTLLDDAPQGARRVSIATAADLVFTGARMRATRASTSGLLGGGLAGGVELAAVVGLALSAAVASAAAVYFGEHGVIFYLLDPRGRGSAVGGQYLLIWIIVAVACWIALAAMVRGRYRLAAAFSGAATGYTLLVAAIMIRAAQRMRIGTIEIAAPVPGPRSATAGGYPSVATGTPLHSIPGGEFSFRYMNFVATPALLAIFVIATTATVFCALRRDVRTARSAQRTWWWLVAAGIVALLFVVVGDGSGASGTFANLSYSLPPQGGIMTAFQCLWVGGVLVGLAWSRLDPRVGWAITLLSLPFLAYQISALTIGRFYYGELYQPWWQTNLPLIAVTIAMVALTASAANVSRKLRRL